MIPIRHGMSRHNEALTRRVVIRTTSVRQSTAEGIEGRPKRGWGPLLRRQSNKMLKRQMYGRAGFDLLHKRHRRERLARRRRSGALTISSR